VLHYGNFIAKAALEFFGEPGGACDSIDRGLEGAAAEKLNERVALQSGLGGGCRA